MSELQRAVLDGGCVLLSISAAKAAREAEATPIWQRLSRALLEDDADVDFLTANQRGFVTNMVDRPHWPSTRQLTWLLFLYCRRFGVHPQDVA